MKEMPFSGDLLKRNTKHEKEKRQTKTTKKEKTWTKKKKKKKYYNNNMKPKKDNPELNFILTSSLSLSLSSSTTYLH
jgi:hypothetical protein